MADSAVFDDDNLVSCAGLVPVMRLAEQTGLAELLGEKVHIAETRIKSGSANPAPKLATLMGGMCAGADSIDDVDVVRSGGMKTLFDDVYAASTIGLCCGSSVSGMPASWNRCCAGIWGCCVREPSCCPALACALSSTSTHCCARSTDTPNRAPASGTPRSQVSRCCARGCPRWSPRSAPSPLHR